MVFDGFPAGMPRFFADLAQHNDRSWWNANRDRYQDEVAEPIGRMVEELAEEFGPAHRFRPNRDVRFGPDKRPYQEHASFAVARPGGTLYAQFGAHEAVVAGGRWQPSTAELTRFRELVDDPRTGAEVEEQLAELARAGLRADDDAVLKTAPRGFPRDHPRIALLRRTRLSVAARRPNGSWLRTAEALDVIRALWRDADRWNAWLREHVPEPPAGDGRRGRR